MANFSINLYEAILFKTLLSSTHTIHHFAQVVRELLMINQTAQHTPGPNNSEDWVEEEELTQETIVKMEGIKMMARWLLGLKSDEISAQKTFRMLNHFIISNGDLLKTGKML